MRARKHAFLGTFALLLAGCMTSREIVTLPAEDSLVRDQLVIFSDFRLPRHHRLVEELVARRHDVVDRLELPTSDEPIHVYLFDTSQRYKSFMARRFPEFPHRRAFFVESDTRLTIYAHWGDRVAEDLRHEVTHGYLHTMVPYLPLWMDEGLAEYFEVPRGHRGLNRAHVQFLCNAMLQQRWAPNLTALEQVQTPGEMTQQQYAEAWAWVHLMLESTTERRDALRNHLARIRITGTAAPLSQTLYSMDPLNNRALVEHLLELQKRSG